MFWEDHVIKSELWIYLSPPERYFIVIAANSDGAARGFPDRHAGESSLAHASRSGKYLDVTVARQWQEGSAGSFIAQVGIF